MESYLNYSIFIVLFAVYGITRIFLVDSPFGRSVFILQGTLYPPTICMVVSQSVYTQNSGCNLFALISFNLIGRTSVCRDYRVVSPVKFATHVLLSLL